MQRVGDTLNDDAKYGGAEPWSARYVSIATLNVIHLECNSLWQAEPMETDARISDVVATSQVEDEPC